MTNQHHRRLHELFTAAVALPAGQRDAWLQVQCGDDPTLLDEVRALVAEDARSLDPLEAGVGQVIGQPTGDSAIDRISMLAEFASRRKDELPDSDLSSDEFCDQLSGIEVLTSEELAAWLESLQPPRLRKNPHAMAKRLISDGKLTRFQAAVLLGGKSQQLLIDKYLILDLIDSGGMGMVFKAVHRPMNRVVALKMLPPQRFPSSAAVQRFRREVQVAATLQHPNIVTAFDADESNGVHFLVMEYARGRDLYKTVTKYGPLEVSQAVRCILQAASGLQHAHEQGIIHRDIKPGNLVLADRRTVKVLDLGLASIGQVGETENEAAPESGHVEDQLTQHGTLLGTVAYMAPEQASDLKAVDARSDIYSLGCTFFFLLTGETPFGSDRTEALKLHRQARIPSLRDVCPDVPESVDTIFQRMLAKDPNERQSSMSELITELRACEIFQDNETSPSSQFNQDASPPPPPVETVPSVNDWQTPLADAVDEESESPVLAVADTATVFDSNDSAFPTNLDTTKRRRRVRRPAVKLVRLIAGMLLFLTLYFLVIAQIDSQNRFAHLVDLGFARSDDDGGDTSTNKHDPDEPPGPIGVLQTFDLEIPEPEVSATQFAPVEMESDLFADSLIPINNDSLMSTVPSRVFQGRHGALRTALISIYGGTPETETAVARGLKWLKRNQSKDGNWDLHRPYSDPGFSENDIAATAMALLTLLGDGNTHKTGEYADNVDRGIKYLITKQDRSGSFFRSVDDNRATYAQALATIVLCELYGMTKETWLRPNAEAALKYAVRSQSSLGGWRYKPRLDSDTSVTGWYVTALVTGRDAGLQIDPTVLDGVSKYLDRVSHSDDSAYAYQIGKKWKPSPSMTAAGLYCRQHLGWNRSHPPLLRGIDRLVLDNPIDFSDPDVYYWYYATEAIRNLGGSPWRNWNDVMRVELPSVQVKGGPEDGSWSPLRDRYGGQHGRLYTTCFSLLCLETYYRRMPLYAANEKSKARLRP